MTAEDTGWRAFRKHYRAVFLTPRRAFSRLVADPRRLMYGALALLISALLYTLVFLALAMAGGIPVIPPFLNIPLEDYYWVSVPLVVPLLFSAWILAAGVVQLLSRRWGGTGSFEATAALLGFAIVPPTFVTMIPDGVSGILSLLGVIGPDPLLWTTQGVGQAVSTGYLVLYNLWFLVLFPLAVIAAQKVSLGRAALLGAAGYGVYQALLLIFLR